MKRRLFFDLSITEQKIHFGISMHPTDHIDGNEYIGVLEEISPELAHDVGTLLSSILTYFQLLEEDEASAAPLAKSASRNAAELASLLRQARIFSADDHLVASRCGLRQMVKRTGKLCLAFSSETPVQFEINIPEDAFVTANAVLLQRLMTNVMKNALESGARRIEISRQEQSDAGGALEVIRVKDDGLGIAPQNLSRIFETGYSTKANSGLGLSIARKIVAVHGGRIECRSVLGEGTEIEICLPCGG